MHVINILFFLLISIAFVAASKSYEGYKVYKVVPKTQNDMKNLEDIQKSGIGEFWVDQFNLNHKVKIMVSSEKQNVFLKRMKLNNLVAEEVIPDLQKVIDDQLKPAGDIPRNSQESLLSMTWDRYYDLEAIYNWLDELVEAYPNIVTPVTMGLSNENRPIRGIVISYRDNNTNIGVMEGTLHAREWISPATITWVIKEFLTSTNPDVRGLAENLEWHMFPVVNPDGYVFSFTNNRMWRKNRNLNYNMTCGAGVDNGMSHGVDLNRNFDFEWMTVGASSDPCTNLFAGPSAFSEPESRAIATYVQNLDRRGEIIYYLAFHSYTQLVVIPYSHVEGGTSVLEASNYANMYEIGIRGAEKLRERFGTEYRVGVSADVLYPMSGTSFDWVKYDTDVPVSYLIELRDVGEYGFLLPADQIIPNNLEIMDFLLEMDKTTRFLGYYSGAVNVFSSFIVILFGVMLLYFVP